MDSVKAMLIFAQVMESGSMSAAAKHLGISASAISQHLRQLEKHYAMKLLNRTTRQLNPTLEGEILLKGAQQIQQTLQQTQLRLAHLQTEFKGDVRLSLPTGFLDSLAVQYFLRQLAKQYPQICLHFLPDDNVVNLMENAVDIAIRAVALPPDSPLIARLLTVWQLGIYASPDYLQQNPISQLKDLAQAKWIKFSETAFNTAFHSLALGDFSAEKVIQCSSISSARTLALSGCGLTFQLSGEAAKYVQKGELIQLFPNHPMPQHQIYAVTSHRTQSAKINAVLALLKTAFGE